MNEDWLGLVTAVQEVSDAQTLWPDLEELMSWVGVRPGDQGGRNSILQRLTALERAGLLQAYESNGDGNVRWRLSMPTIEQTLAFLDD